MRPFGLAGPVIRHAVAPRHGARLVVGPLKPPRR